MYVQFFWTLLHCLWKRVIIIYISIFVTSLFIKRRVISHSENSLFSSSPKDKNIFYLLRDLCVIWFAGPPRLPVWGSYWFVLLNNYKFIHIGLHKLANKYKTKILGLHLGPFPAVVVNNYELIREVYTRPEFQGRLKLFLINVRTYNKNLGKVIGRQNLQKHLGHQDLQKRM